MEILHHLRLAHETCRHWSKAWHHWALFNVSAIQHYESSGAPHATVNRHVPAAIRGFFMSINLQTGSRGGTVGGVAPEFPSEGGAASGDAASFAHAAPGAPSAPAGGVFTSVVTGQRRSPASSMQDILRLLTLWFQFGADPDVNRVIEQCMSIVSGNNPLSLTVSQTSGVRGT